MTRCAGHVVALRDMAIAVPPCDERGVVSIRGELVCPGCAAAHEVFLELFGPETAWVRDELRGEVG